MPDTAVSTAPSLIDPPPLTGLSRRARIRSPGLAGVAETAAIAAIATRVPRSGFVMLDLPAMVSAISPPHRAVVRAPPVTRSTGPVRPSGPGRRASQAIPSMQDRLSPCWPPDLSARRAASAACRSCPLAWSQETVSCSVPIEGTTLPRAPLREQLYRVRRMELTSASQSVTTGFKVRALRGSRRRGRGEKPWGGDARPLAGCEPPHRRRLWRRRPLAWTRCSYAASSVAPSMICSSPAISASEARYRGTWPRSRICALR